MVVARCVPHNIFPGSHVLDNGDSISWLPSDVDQVVWSFFPGKLLVLLSILTDLVVCMHLVLVFRLKLKL
jgi:hypothetical protein